MEISSGSQPSHGLLWIPPMKSGPFIHMITVQAYQKPEIISPAREDLTEKLFCRSRSP